MLNAEEPFASHSRLKRLGLVTTCNISIQLKVH